MSNHNIDEDGPFREVAANQHRPCRVCGTTDRAQFGHYNDYWCRTCTEDLMSRDEQNGQEDE